MSILIAVIVGGFVGWVASVLMKTRAQMGLISCIVIGIVGSVLGRWVFGVFGLGAQTPLGGAVISVAGAAILIAVLKALKLLK